jgi:hypothetical protein
VCAIWAQPSTVGTRRDDYAARAKEFFRTSYPDLDGSLRVIVDWGHLDHRDLMNNFWMELYDLKSNDGTKPSECWCSAPVLRAYFIFDPTTADKELIVVAAGGPIVNGRRDKFAEEVNRHPEWTDAQVVTALNDAGARFGPDHKAEFLRTLPIAELKPFVGELEVLSAKFYVRHSGAEGTPPEASLSWTVHA